MEHRCIFAGFGGQGVISMGTLTAYAAMVANKNSTFFPAYGIAMRGGTANCTVIVSDEDIASPIVVNPNIMVVMNEIALDHFLPKIESGGTIFVNESLVKKSVDRDDIKVVNVKASGIATERGDVRMANMVMLGGVLGVTSMMPLDAVLQSMEKTFAAKIQHLIGINKEVMQEGFDSVK